MTLRDPFQMKLFCDFAILYEIEQTCEWRNNESKKAIRSHFASYNWEIIPFWQQEDLDIAMN